MKKEYKRSVTIWLITGAVMVFIMVAIGGITRLTHSGLSMVDWKPISGTLPPLNETEWNTEFENYKQFPEFKKKNMNFGLAEFKSIFWWEYIHRLMGRLIGLAFIIPFAVFAFKRVFNTKWIIKLSGLFLLGGLQGFIGWFMVKSGLVDEPSVSHFRLAIHLCTAFTVFSYILWLLLEIHIDRERFDQSYRKLSFPRWLLAISLVVQIVYGAFVAGLKAGRYFNSWPKMDDNWISPLVSMAFKDAGFSAIYFDPIVIQFIHRLLPYFILAGVLLIWRGAKGREKRNVQWILLAWGFQFLLGILTLVMGVPVWMGVLHQLGAVILLSTAVRYYYELRASKISSQITA